jgi:hypothetical protein
MPRLIGFPCFAASLLFVVCSTASSAQTVTLFGTGTPQTPIDPDTSAVTLGIKFYSTQAGVISGIRFYRGAKNTSGYRARLYKADGTLLASASSTKEPCGTMPCWEQLNFSAPVSIAANTTYIAAYYTSNGRYAGDNNGLTNGKTSTPLIAPASGIAGGNGVYTYSNGFPTQTYKASNYWVDVAFTPSAPSLQISFNPPAPKIPANAPTGTAVSTVNVTWTNGAQFTGQLALPNSDGSKFALSGKDVIVNPSGPGIGADGGTTQNVTVSATQ